jgi:hypothetical protein
VTAQETDYWIAAPEQGGETWRVALVTTSDKPLDPYMIFLARRLDEHMARTIAQRLNG